MTDIATPAKAPALGASLDRGPEVRCYRLADIEWREPDQTGDGQYTFIGHAAVFELLSLPLYDWWFGEFRETIAPGAFTNVLSRNPDVHLVYVHDMASAMARTQSKTLELSQDPRGLRAYARLDPTDTDVQRIAPKMRRGDVDQMSFAFTVARDEWLIENEGTPEEVVTRTIIEVGELFDVSIVPQGAFPQTDGSLRNREVRALIRSAIRRGVLQAPEKRADVEAISCLVGAYELIQEFKEAEDDPDDGPDLAKADQALELIEQLIAAEAAEDEGGENEGSEAVARLKAGATRRKTRRAGGDPAGATTVEPEDPAGGAQISARERRVAEMRQSVDIARIRLPKETD